MVSADHLHHRLQDTSELALLRPHPQGIEISLGNSRPPFLPPALQGKALRQVRIHAVPFLGGQPLPRRLLTCPASAASRLGSPRYVTPPDRGCTVRWVSYPRFCPAPEGAAPGRVGVDPGPSSIICGRSWTTVVTALWETFAWKRGECKPGATERNESTRPGSSEFSRTRTNGVN